MSISSKGYDCKRNKERAEKLANETLEMETRNKEIMGSIEEILKQLQQNSIEWMKVHKKKMRQQKKFDKQQKVKQDAF